MWVSDSMGNNIGWQQMGTWDFPGATPNLVPVNTAVSPSSGSGGAQMFTVTVSDGNGEQDIAHTQLTINDTQDVANACSIFYNRLANWVGLYNDAGTAWTNATLGSAVTLSNSFCSLEVAGVTETVSGNDLMVSFPIVFSGAVLGAQNVYLLTRDKSGFEAGWDSMGTWTVTAHSSTPAVLAIAPNSGNVTSATFTAIYVDGTGAADMSWSYVMFNQVVDWAGSCGVRYNLADNLVYVVNDAGSGWTTGQAPGTATTLSNSTCDLDVSGVTVDQTGLVLTVTYPLTFTTSFSATRNIKMYASDSTANSGWQQMGTWDFPGGTPNEVPVNGTLSPSSGSGGSQTFTVTGSDGNGAQDIAQIFWLINTGITGVNACYLRYNQVANLAYLLNDLGNSWGTGATPGSVTTLTNSFCTVQMAGATVSAVGNDLTLTYPIVFDGTAQGAKNIYQLTRDNSGYQDGWDQVGTWTIVQVIVDVTPPSVTFLQSGETQQFTANVSNATDPSVTWSYSPRSAH